jgi:DNA-binding transcriptional LysR family regulator
MWPTWKAAWARRCCTAAGRWSRPRRPAELLIDRARRLLAEADEAWWTPCSARCRGQGGRVRLGASTGAIVHLLPQVLQVLAAAAPGIDVQVAGADVGRHPVAAWPPARLDVGLVALPQPPRAGVQVQPWRRDPVLAVLPAAWPDLPDTVAPAWLAARPLVLNDAGTHLARLCADWFAQAGLAPARAHHAELQRCGAQPGGRRVWRVTAAARRRPWPAWLDARLATRPLDPPLWRALGLARRDGPPDALVDRVWQLLQAQAG